MLLIGLMSGTSVDAVDAAVVRISRAEQQLTLEVVGFVMHPYPAATRERICRLLPPESGSTAGVCEVNALIGEAFAGAAAAAAADAGVALSEVAAIASHGQTVYHQVAAEAVRSTLQLGSPGVIAEMTGCTVISDFRARDIAAGGQGAPLVSYLDQLLFSSPTRHRAVQNIGGIANVTYLPRGGSEVIGFDTGPGNLLLDEAMATLQGSRMDEGGRFAGSGTVHVSVVDEWLRHPYLHTAPPKSTGREAWGAEPTRIYLDECRERGLKARDAVACLTSFVARGIAQSYELYLGPVDEIVVSGGGARNPLLLRLLQEAVPSAMLRHAGEFGVDADAKEAVAFALMGYATLHQWPSNVPAVTGASHRCVLGSVTPGSNYTLLMHDCLSPTGSAPTSLKMTTAQ